MLSEIAMLAVKVPKLISIKPEETVDERKMADIR